MIDPHPGQLRTPPPIAETKSPSHADASQQISVGESPPASQRAPGSIVSSKEVAAANDSAQSEEGQETHGTLLPSGFRQLRWTLAMCFGMIPLSILLFLYVYAALVIDNPPLGPLLFSPSQTLLVVTILSQGLALLLRMLFNCTFESLRWHLASRENGVAVTTFLGLSAATSSLGVLRLFFEAGIRTHTLWYIQRYKTHSPIIKHI